MKTAKPKPTMPSLETIQQELGKAKTMHDFFGKEGIFARLFAETLEQMLEAELTAHLGVDVAGTAQSEWSIRPNG